MAFFVNELPENQAYFQDGGSGGPPDLYRLGNGGVTQGQIIDGSVRALFYFFPSLVF